MSNTQQMHTHQTTHQAKHHFLFLICFLQCWKQAWFASVFIPLSCCQTSIFTSSLQCFFCFFLQWCCTGERSRSAPGQRELAIHHRFSQGINLGAIKLRELGSDETQLSSLIFTITNSISREINILLKTSVNWQLCFHVIHHFLHPTNHPFVLTWCFAIKKFHWDVLAFPWSLCKPSTSSSAETAAPVTRVRPRTPAFQFWRTTNETHSRDVYTSFFVKFLPTSSVMRDLQQPMQGGGIASRQCSRRWGHPLKRKQVRPDRITWQRNAWHVITMSCQGGGGPGSRGVSGSSVLEWGRVIHNNAMTTRTIRPSWLGRSGTKKENNNFGNLPLHFSLR